MTQAAHNHLMPEPSAHVVPILDIGVAAVVHRGPGGQAAITPALLSRMPLLPAGDLRALIQAVLSAGALLSEGQALVIIAGLAQVLEDLRARRIAHG